MCALIHRTASDEYKQEAKDQDEKENLEQLVIPTPSSPNQILSRFNITENCRV